MAAIVLAFLAAACSDSTRADRPDPATFHFPTAVVADPSGNWVFVVSTNFDSLYSGGVVVPIEAATRTVVSEGAVEVGSFAGEFSVYPGSDGRVAGGFLALRDEDAVLPLDLAWTEAGLPRIGCGTAEDDAFPRCGKDALTVTELLRDAVVEEERDEYPEARDPFAMHVGAPVMYAGPDGVVEEPRPLYVGSLRDGAFLVFTLAADGTPEFKKGLALSAGLHSIVEWPVSARERVVVISNRMQPLLHVVRVFLHPDGRVDAVIEEPIAFTQLAATGDYYRGMALSVAGPTLYVAFRSPASLAVLDFGPDGRPVPRGLVGLSGKPGYVAVWAPEGRPQDEAVYVSDFGGDAVYVVDPVQMAVTDRIVVGAGPYGLAVAADTVFVANFEEGAVSVIPLALDDPRRHQEVERLK
jgi:YVTN family beta-propeller protein